MAQRLMFVHQKSAVDVHHDTDAGPSWISMVRFSRTWRTAYWHDRTLARVPGGLGDANFCDVDTGEAFWLSGPRRDRRDVRHGAGTPTVDEDAATAYAAHLVTATRSAR